MALAIYFAGVAKPHQGWVSILQIRVEVQTVREASLDRRNAHRSMLASRTASARIVSLKGRS